MDEDIIPTRVQKETLATLLKKIFSKSKSAHLLRYDSGSNEIKLRIDKLSLGIVCLEAPYILLPNYDLINLVEKGKCCSYCGAVLKIYDKGKMKDDGNKSDREKQTAQDKHERFVNGLDCFTCEVRWCDKQCKNLDFKHNLLYHRPSNKTASHNFTSVDGSEKDTFYFDRWKKVDKMVRSNNWDLVYNTLMCILHIYYDSNLKDGFESLKCFDSDEITVLESFIMRKLTNNESIDLKTVWESFSICFKHFEMEYVQFLKYITIFQLNNYNGSIYLIFSSIKKSKTADPNLKVEYFDGNTTHVYEEFSLRTTETKSIKILSEEVIDDPSVKPIYTNRASGIVDKQIIEISSCDKITNLEELILPDQDYSNPVDVEDDDIAFISDDNSDIDVPKIILPVVKVKQTSNKLDVNHIPKIRTASFTSSGASFGEGIIKYNRDQIREMLENISHNLINEESDDENAIDEVHSSTDSESTVSKNIVYLVKNLQIAPNTQRRKSVKFEETVATI